MRFYLLWNCCTAVQYLSYGTWQLPKTNQAVDREISNYPPVGRFWGLDGPVVHLLYVCTVQYSAAAAAHLQDPVEIPIAALQHPFSVLQRPLALPPHLQADTLSHWQMYLSHRPHRTNIE